MGNSASYEKVIGALAKNYEEMEQSIVNQLLMDLPNHYPTAGSYREMVWKSLFEMIIPRKYCVEKGVFIIDSFGHKSKEVDLVIFDEIYTPYIFNYGEIKFIPIEAVAAVVQCKSTELDTNVLKEWTESIDQLLTSLDAVARMATGMIDNNEDENNNGKSSWVKQETQTATRPIKILCSLAGKKKRKSYDNLFDIMLSVDENAKRIFKYIPQEKQGLVEWNDSLNHALDGISDPEDKKRRENRQKKFESNRNQILQDLRVGKSEDGSDENVIFSLIFQLNQLLMISNNPMLFPHHAYAGKFTEILKASHQSEGGDKDEK